MTDQLPEPARERWQPLRAGLVEMFYYEAEEFWFRDGRLLLRGNNGTGKSKVLALTLPFLLDADLSAHRVEPDADGKKRMEWNLLLGGAHPQPERTGYSWLEFGRRDADGEAHYFTIGAGLKAVSGRGMVKRWFFTTTRRIGESLWLVDSTRSPLTRERLADAIGIDGDVTETAGHYRAMIDEKLFGLGEARYRALVDLLIQLRQPQLSKRPDEHGLSNALTEALPPVGQDVIADVAEAFRSLEDDQDELARLERLRKAVGAFAGYYRLYARMAVKRRAGSPGSAQYEYERENSARTAAIEAARSAREDAVLADSEVKSIELEQSRLGAEREALLTGDLADRATDLERARTERDRAAREQRDASDRLDAAEKESVLRRARADAATSAASESRTRFDQLRAELLAAADDAGMSQQATEAIDPLARQLVNGPDSEEQFALDPVLRSTETRLAELAARRRTQLARIRELLAAARAADDASADRQRQVDQVHDDLTGSDEQLARDEEEIATTGAALVTDFRERLLAAIELVEPRAADDAEETTGEQEPGLATAIAELESWVETLDGQNPARRYAERVRSAVVGDISGKRASVLSRESETREELDAVNGRIQELESGVVPVPPGAYTRDAESREVREGAPLWRVVDFGEHVPAADRAGLEAALEASGLLDAWITPTGELLDLRDETVLVAAAAPTTGRKLSDLLVVDGGDGFPVRPATVDAILSSIGLGNPRGESYPSTDAAAWVDVSGRFALGPLRGNWQKPAAQYIGATAREARRLTLLADERMRQQRLEQRLEEAHADLVRLLGREATLTTEYESLPNDDRMWSTHAAAAQTRARRSALRERLESEQRALEDAVGIARIARTELHDAAADLGLPSDIGALDEVGQAVDLFAVHSRSMMPSATSLLQAVRAVSDAETDLLHAADAESQAAAAHRQRESDLVATTQRHATLDATVGADVAELQRERARVDGERKDTETRLGDARDALNTALELRGSTKATVDEAERRVGESAERRRQATAAFQLFARSGLLLEAAPDVDLPDLDTEWAPDPTVRLARRIDSELAEVDGAEDAWVRAQRRINAELEEVTEALSEQGHSAIRSSFDDVTIVEIVFSARPTTAARLSTELADDVSERRRLLDEREREVLENYLIDEVASTLQDLIHQAELQVGRMNEELGSRPTSTGMRLRLQWLPRDDGPDGFGEARRRILRQRADAWSSDDRAAIGVFLKNRIDQIRATDQTGTWTEQLTDALDYRRWNRFAIQIHQNGQWRSAAGPASGGERVLAASVPLFAAASAHYSSAGNPWAPRMIMLDEAFAGVDDRARADYLGLLTEFDLDVVMTSEREWACYPQVPGIAIAQLSRAEGVDAVLVQRWEWDGASRWRMDDPSSSAIAERESRAADEALV